MATLNVLVMCRNLNMMAFVKILKKFEKITGKQVLSIYLKVVESSYFNSSDQACVTHICSVPLSVYEYSGIWSTEADEQRTRCSSIRVHCRR